MKLGQFFKKMVGGSMILAAMACPVFTSCYDDSKLWDEMGKVKDQVASLESRLNDELAALQYMLGAESKIKDVKWDDTNKKWTFTLANGTTLDFTPSTFAENQQKHQSFITTVEVEGAKYWATYGADGTATALTDADGNMYPVSVTPQVKTEGGVTYLSLDGETWVPTCSNPSVFTNVEVVYSDIYTDEEEEDEWNQEVPMYVIFTLADGNTISVSLDGAMVIIGGHAGIIKTQFVAPGKSVMIQVAMTNIKSFLKELPAGWKATENLEGFKYGIVEFTVTAPSADMIARGDAAASGPFRIMGNAEGGSVVMGEATLTTEPFSVFSVGATSVTVNMNNGLGGYICGISAKDNFDSEAVLNEVKAEVEGEDWSPWYTDLNYQNNSLSESYQMIDPTITYGSEYVFWTVSLESWVNYETYESGYNVIGIQYDEFTYSEIVQDEEKVVPSFDDVTTEIAFKGVTSVYVGFAEAGYYGLPTNAEIVSELNQNLRYVSMGMPDPAVAVADFTTEGIYSGSITGLDPEVKGTSLMPSSEYSVWFVIKKEGATSYLESDVVRFDYSTVALQPGGTLSVTATQTEITTAPRKYSTIEASLVSADAAFIYYAWLTPEILPTIDKAAYLLENGTVTTTGGNATISSLAPGTSRVLLTMAVDQSGKYSEPQYATFTTSEYVYNNLTVNVEVVGEPVKGTTTLKFSANGEVAQYVYYVCAADNAYYMSPSYLGGSAENASAYIAMNSAMYWLKKLAASSADAVTATTNSYGDYVAVVAAQDASGVMSRATVLPFTVSFDLGNFVMSKDANGNDNAEWVAKKPTVNITTETVGDFTHVNWTITNIPEGFTAQTAIIHDDYLVDYPSDRDKANFLLTSSSINLEDVSAEGHSYAYGSPGYNVYVLIKDAEGNYYAPYKYECNIAGGGFAQ